MRSLGILLSLSLFAPIVHARRDIQSCATTQNTAAEVRFLHRQSARTHPRPHAVTVNNNRDIGNLAIIEATPGVVETLNQFNLDASTLTFAPTTPAAYRYEISGLGYDASASSQGSPVIALGDDDSRAITLPFAFTFFGVVYRQVFLNSDGNLTFTAADSASSGRSVGRMTGGLPRISPLFDDLDPSQPGASVRVFSDASHVVFTWINVPEYSQFGAGSAQTFQARLYLDGHIQFSYQGVAPVSAVVGIAPGSERNGTSFVSFRNDPSNSQPGATVERFGNTQDIDIVSVAQKFYETHEDAYDYLVVYNNLNIPAAIGAVAYESTVRSSGTGYGVPPADDGAGYGSPARLHSVLNMGPLANYPVDPNGTVEARSAAMDSPLTVLGHEAGHLFLAFASVPDPNNSAARPMIGYGGSHWSFVFNSEASLDEGEQITDRGAAVSPRFATTAVTQGYAPLDRYLMGFGPASDVPPTFFVTGYDTRFISPLSHPATGVAFNGTPVPVTVADLAQVMGRRTPDSTVAQHHYRFGFILIVAPGSLDAAIAGDVQQVDAYRQQFPAAYVKFSAGLASAETSLNRSLGLSLSPAAGIVAGTTSTATLTLSSAPRADLIITIATPKAIVQAPATVIVPAGAKSASFAVTGLKGGVEELTATPSDSNYETGIARVQVASAGQLTLRTVSGDNQLPSVTGAFPAPVVVALADLNGLVYAGARITAVAAAGGSVTPAVAVTDSTGQASFQWTPGPASIAALSLALESAPTVTLRLNAGSGAPVIGAVVNAASSLPGIAAGSIDTLYGANLAGAALSLNGVTLNQLYSGDSQINFYVPAAVPPGPAALTVLNPAGITATTRLSVTATDPGIFPGAIVHAGAATSADTTAVHGGDYIEIYCTGLGPTRAVSGLNLTTVAPVVYLGATPVSPVFSGLAPGFLGLYQVDVQIPAGLPSGRIPVTVASGQTYSNQVNITVQ